MALGNIFPRIPVLDIWGGTGAIDAISDRLQKELPGLRGFSARNLRNMRMFYEEWAPLDNKDAEVDKPVLANTSAKMNTDVQHPVIWQKRLPNSDGMRSSAFVSIG